MVVQSALCVKLLEKAGQAAVRSIQSANLTLLSVDGACVLSRRSAEDLLQEAAVVSAFKERQINEH